MSKNLDPQETAKTIANIEAVSEITFPKDPGKAFEFLENFEKEHKDNPEIKTKIEVLRKKFFVRMQADMALMLTPDPKLAIAQPGEINPKLIYIAESNHADAAYGSLAEQLIKKNEELGLKTQTFSEFSSQAEKIRTQGKLKNKTDEESFRATSDFLSPPVLTKMGSLQEREDSRDKIFEKLKGLRPSELKDLGLDEYIDSPELRKLFAEELEEKIENGDKRLETKRDFLWWIGGFYAAATHAKMANDVRESLNPEADVVIIIAGSPHIPCLGALLEDDFPNSKPIVITRPSGQTLFPLVLSDSTPEALSAVGKVVGFETDAENKARISPKYPDELSKLMEINSESKGEERDQEAWIMSISKSFCGATAALMAVDGKFGEKKMEATLLDVLQVANLEHPERGEEIEQYREAILQKGCGDVTLSQLLSNRSGLTQEEGYFTDEPIFRGDNLGLFRSDEILPFKQDKVGDFSYGNPTFALAEDLIGLVSDSASYRQELQSRVIDPLGLEHTRPLAESEEAKKTTSDVVKIAGMIDCDSGKKSQRDVRCSSLEYTQTGPISLAAGGLCSSVSDMEIYSEALAKTICGIPNPLTEKLTPGQQQEVHGYYLDAHRLGDGEFEIPDDSTDLVKYCYKHYSLGIIVGAVDEQGKRVDARENSDQKCLIMHTGGFVANGSGMKVVMPFSFDDFVAGNPELDDRKIEKNIAMSQYDSVASHLLLTAVSHDYADKIDEYFAQKSEPDNEFLNDKWREYSKHLKVTKGEKISPDWQADLIERGMLPQNFAEYHDEILEAYKPAQEALRQHIVENYLDETGVLNREKIAQDFSKAEDFEKLHEEVLAPHLEAAHEKVENIFTRSEIKLAAEKVNESAISTTTKSWVDKTSAQKGSSEIIR